MRLHKLLHTKERFAFFVKEEIQYTYESLMSLVSHKKSYLVCDEFFNIHATYSFFFKSKIWDTSQQSAETAAISNFEILSNLTINYWLMTCQKQKISKNIVYLPYARHYNCIHFNHFLKFIYVLWPLILCMVSIQERFLIKSRL